MNEIHSLADNADIVSTLDVLAQNDVVRVHINYEGGYDETNIECSFEYADGTTDQSYTDDSIDLSWEIAYEILQSFMDYIPNTGDGNLYGGTATVNVETKEVYTSKEWADKVVRDVTLDLDDAWGRTVSYTNG